MAYCLEELSGPMWSDLKHEQACCEDSLVEHGFTRLFPVRHLFGRWNADSSPEILISINEAWEAAKQVCSLHKHSTGTKPIYSADFSAL